MMIAMLAPKEARMCTLKSGKQEMLPQYQQPTRDYNPEQTDYPRAILELTGMVTELYHDTDKPGATYEEAFSDIKV